MAVKISIIADNKSRKAFTAVTHGIQKIGSSAVKSTKNLALLTIGVGLLSTKLAGDLQKGLLEVTTLMDDVTENTIKNMSKELRGLASATGQGLQPLVKARYDIVSAGFFKIAESAQVLNASAKLAVGGVTSVDKSADLLTTTLNAYNKSAEESVKVTDKLFTIVRLGKTTIGEISGSFGRLVSIASPAGVSLNEVGASLATLTSQGQKTEEAMTAIRALIVELQKPSEDLAKALDSVGVKNSELTLKTKGLAFTLNKVKEASIKSGKTFTQLFSNIRSLQAVLPLTTTGATKLAESLEGMANSAGATDKAFAIMLDSINVKFARMKQNVISILITLGDVIIKAISDDIDKINNEMERLGKIGWDVVGKEILKNISVIFQAVKDIVKVSLSLLPPLISQIFKIAGKSAVVAFKIGMESFDIDFKNILFGGEQRNNALKFANIFGRDVAEEFVNSGGKEFGKLNEVISANLKDGKASKELFKMFEDAGINALMAGIIMDGVKKGSITGISNLEQAFGDFKFTADVDVAGDLSSFNEGFVGQVKIAMEQIAQIIDKTYTDVIPQTVADGNKAIVDSNKETFDLVGGTIKEASAEIDQRLHLAFKPQPVKEFEKSTESSFINLQDKINAWGTSVSESLTATFGSTLQNVQMLGGLGSALLGKEMAEIDGATAEKIRLAEEEFNAGQEILARQNLSDEEMLERQAQLEKQKADKIEAINKKADKDRAKARKKQKPFLIAEALANTALGVIKALPNLVKAGLVATIGAIQVATIRAQKFIGGGAVLGGGGASDDVPAILKRGEFVVDAPTVTRQGGVSEFAQRLQDPVVQSGGGDVYNTNISAVDAKSLERLFMSNPRAFNNGLKGAVKSGMVKVESDSGVNSNLSTM